MASAEVLRANFLASEMNRELFRKRDAGKRDGRAGRVFVVWLLNVLQIGAHVLMGDALGDRQHLQITAGMIVVLMGVDDVSNRLLGDRFHLGQYVGVVS